MPRVNTLALALAALFAMTQTACTADSVDSTDEQEEDGLDEATGEAASALNPVYSISTSGTNVEWIYGEEVEDFYVHSCDMFTNGVVRSWQLKEKNAKDFRFSRHWCRPMMNNGTLGSSNDFYDHFYYDGSGTLGMSSVPLDELPVGVRFQAEYQPLSSAISYKISDVALLSQSAADVLAQHTGYDVAPYALGRTNSTFTLRCPVGKVMTGLGVDEWGGGSDQSHIVGLKIRCSTLVYQ